MFRKGMTILVAAAAVAILFAGATLIPNDQPVIGQDQYQPGDDHDRTMVKRREAGLLACPVPKKTDQKLYLKCLRDHTDE